MGLPWLPLLFMGLGTTAFTLWVGVSFLSSAAFLLLPILQQCFACITGLPNLFSRCLHRNKSL